MSGPLLIENEGSLYRGFARGFPTEVWSPRRAAFVPYKGRVPKPINWGDLISEEDACQLIAELSVSPDDGPT